MEVDLIPTLINQFREAFEGQVSEWTWIVDGGKATGVFGTIEPLSAEQAFALPRLGGRSVAAHVEHLRFSLELFLRRLNGEDPQPDWTVSFDLPAVSAHAWQTLQQRLRSDYDAAVAFLMTRKSTPIAGWPSLHLAGLTAMIGHNSYHLGAIRQIARIVTKT